MILIAAGVVAFVLWWRQSAPELSDGSLTQRPAPVLVAPIEQGSIEARRTFSGSIDAAAEFVVAPKVAGRIESLTVDIADRVTRGQVVARLDDDELAQAVASAEADYIVAEANLTEARNALQIAERELRRIETLRERGVSSESQYDLANAEFLAQQSALAVAEAQLLRAQSDVETAFIRSGYTKVAADWSSEDQSRVVAERYVDEGDSVSVNDPLFLIVDLDPVTGVIFVTESDYSQFETGQRVELETDAFPGEIFVGKVARIAPIFSAASRQARVEIEVPNPDHRLKPGMFIRATVVLARADDATIVPRAALTRRNDTDGVFLLSDDRQTVSWRPVTIGIESDSRVQVIGDGLEGWVVTLGQNLVHDGSPVTLPEEIGTGSMSVANPEAQ